MPYVGVSGVNGLHQQAELEAVANEVELHEGLNRRVLLLGIKATHKTQYLDVPNKYGEEFYPVGEKGFQYALDRSVSSRDSVLPVAQIYLEPELATDNTYRQAFTDKLLSRGGSWLRGMQYDMLPWHQHDFRDYLGDVREIYGRKIILQAHGPAMDDLGPARLAQALGQYGPVLDYVLFDSSHGKGEKLHTAQLRKFLHEAYSVSELDHIGFGIAGGLDEEIVRGELPPLLREFPDLSWDAEGKLHPIIKQGARPLNMRAAKRYLQASAHVIKNNSQP